MLLRIYQQASVRMYVDRYGIGFLRNLITWTDDAKQAGLYSFPEYLDMIRTTKLPLEAEGVDMHGELFHIVVKKL